MQSNKKVKRAAWQAQQAGACPKAPPAVRRPIGGGGQWVPRAVETAGIGGGRWLPRVAEETADSGDGVVAEETADSGDGWLMDPEVVEMAQRVGAQIRAERVVRDEVQAVRDAERSRILAQLPAGIRWRPDTVARRRHREIFARDSALPFPNPFNSYINRLDVEGE